MTAKIGAILGSVRFWQLVLIAAIQIALGTGVIDGATAQAWAQGIQLLLGGSITLGTIDSFALKASGR